MGKASKTVDRIPLAVGSSCLTGKNEIGWLVDLMRRPFPLIELDSKIKRQPVS